MEASTIRTSASRILSTNKYHGKKQAEKAYLLNKEEKIPKLLAAKLTGVNRKAIYRAERALGEGRMVGIQGKPKVFNETDITEILRLIRELKSQQKVTINDVQELVNFP